MNQEQLQERKRIVKNLIYDPDYRPMRLKEMAFLLQVKKEDREDFYLVLDELIHDGSIIVTPKGKYCKPEKQLVRGKFIGNTNGYGFVECEQLEGDIFIPEKSVNGAFHGDTVLCRIIASVEGDRRAEGSIVRVIERGMTTIVGTFSQSRNYGFVIPDNLKFAKDIYISKENSKGLVDGHKVVVKILTYGNRDKNPEGEVIEILGHRNDPGVDILSIVLSHQLPTEFPPEVVEQCKSIPEQVIEEEIKNRLDYREKITVTIDGEDAKDLDDAITLEKQEGFYELGVHIADVSHYVTEGSPLDQEAYKRGTSVYLIDRVIPMLPHQLSNGICSLNAGTDRLALSCIMKVDMQGKVFDYQICETVIHVDRRMSYTSVRKILIDKDEKERQEYEEFIPLFENMLELSAVLRERRKERGSIDFDFPETKITLDENGWPIKIMPYERNAAHKMIEDFMLLANETIAENYYWQDIPFLYRTHEKPDEEKIHKLKVLIQNFGYFLKSNHSEIHPKEIQKLLARIEGSPEEPFISRIALRSMKQARYSAECIGHFGLSAKYYSHFTSPIRRYPDLQIHRIIKEMIHGEMNEKRLEHYRTLLPKVAESTSKTERTAEEAEREVEKRKMTLYMSERIGQIYDGIISGMTGWGMYVQLDNTIEGMIPLAQMEDDFYFYDEEKYVMIGECYHREFRMGQKVKIRVLSVDEWQNTIDFELYEG